MTTPTVNPVVKVAPRSISADYAALGVEIGYKPRAAEDLRFFVTGPAGKGKTTWVSSIPDTLILDCELGADAIAGAQAARVRIQGYKHYDEIIKKLIEDGENKRRKFKRIVFDTIDEWVHMIAAQLAMEHGCEDIAEYGDKGSGWRLLATRCWKGIQALSMAGYSWTVVGHLRAKTIKHPVTKKDATILRPTIFPTLADRVISGSDFYTTIWMESKTEQEMETIKVQGATIKRLKKGAEKTTNTYWFDLRAVHGHDGKARGVPNMKSHFAIPRIGGWKAFVDKYNAATDEIKKNPAWDDVSAVAKATF